ncbi:unnamed protein product [Ostreobium quekettii]|uniref:Uncharacterized protein n=1 Tax=Ostreobium quekettii TaxID=121088 RepID=A0A8S1IV94_9CHLO|nr:unnamed protein product [Ostreobium quekettii]|eukprot:evm.model.scf_678.3 EVM.evm.TU.scf_678.3   scf_678:37707-39062(-)
MYDVLQQTRQDASPTPARGPPRRSARDLKYILQQVCPPTPHISKRAGGPVGDQWLDAKGKRWLPGVEDRLGRRDLFQALHRGRPKPLGLPTGDIWLDKKGKRFLRSTGDHDVYAILRTPMPAKPPDVIWVSRRHIANIEQGLFGLTGAEGASN